MEQNMCNMVKQLKRQIKELNSKLEIYDIALLLKCKHIEDYKQTLSQAKQLRKYVIINNCTKKCKNSQNNFKK